MNNVLVINSSIMNEGSVSRQLSEDLLTVMTSNNDDLSIVRRDFSETPIPHLDGQRLQALMTPQADRNSEQQSQVDFSDSLINEVQAADTLLITLPMYNFSVPSMLKAWVDHIARAGVTFKYTDQGPEGLLKNKKVYFLAALGGVHEAGKTDFMRPFMKLIMSFIGIEDVEFISAEGLNMGPEARQQGLDSAQAQIAAVLAQESLVTLKEVNYG